MESLFEAVASGFDIAGVLVITYGAAVGFVRIIIWHVQNASKRANRHKPRLNDVRRFIVEHTILALDFFVGADLVRTVAKPSFAELGILAGIILIRIVLTYFLERELGEQLPE